MVRLNQIFLKVTDSVLNSYTQIFFSNNKIFAIILITVSFFDAVAGLSGMVAVITVNTTAYLIGFNRGNIRSGFYGFNALLVGLGLGIFYGLNAQYFLVLVFASIFTLFLTVVLEGLIGKYGLPYLSLPFLLGIWTTTLAFREFQALRMSERGLFMFNEMYASGGGIAMRIYQWFNHLNLPESVIIYFKSLGAILFQYHLFAGIIIAMGLIIYSRIAFVLSVTGFFAAYLFYEIVGGNLYELSYFYIGFNFILTSIAVGGFFIIPSRYSYLWVILLIPLISVVVTATMVLLGLFQLSIFSLPFNLIVIMFLYILKFRERFYGSPEITVYQQFSPEKNLYSSLNNRERFYDYKFHSLSLPFWGEWKVTQAHHGEYTHRREWAHAWDFEITDEQGIPYRNTGTETEEYYCYNKPVISPADGWIEEILDGIDDNKISEINLEHNWGNTVVIRHSDKLFSKLCHLRKGTFKVK
ncbi:MAG: peptidase M23, partial [Bacteroidetes bacterium]|nr:peptidase M23 [Bacteroidota bacterium]